MDDRYFDALARTVTERGTRRGLLGFLTTLPLVGGLAALLGDEESAAKSRRTKPHQARTLTAQKKRKKKERKKRKPQSLATTCAGTCGAVKNYCQKTVDCGSCEPGKVRLAGTCKFCGYTGEPCCAGDICFEGTCSGEQCQT